MKFDTAINLRRVGLFLTLLGTAGYFTGRHVPFASPDIAFMVAMMMVALIAVLLFLTFPRLHSAGVNAASTETDSILLDTVLNNVTIGICVFDANLKLLKWNNNYADIMEISDDVLHTGMMYQEILALNYQKYRDIEENEGSFITSVTDEIKYSMNRKVDRYFKDGKIVEIFSSSCPEGGVVTTVKDVTAARLAEKVHRDNEERYRLMVDLSPDAIVAHKDGFIIYVNNAALKLFRVKNRHALIGQQIRSFFPFADSETLIPYFGCAKSIEATEKLPTRKSRVIFQDGAFTNVEIDVSPLFYGERRILQLIIRDISAQTQIEDFLKQAREEAEYAAKLKGTFLANMSHELRTPLNAVIGFSEVITSELFGDIGSRKYLEYANDIHASGLHLLELINDILDFSKIEAGEQTINEEIVAIDVLVNECIRLTRQRAVENNISIKVELDPFLPRIFADRRMLKQILINLLSNAIKFTPAGGRIVTSVQTDGRDGMRISVRDNGIGIREDDIEKAMTPFVQIDSEKNRKYHGTGLGLPLSKNLAEMHDGKLELMSEYGEGTVVSLCLPAFRIREQAA
ncbi:ATP-binding protein [Sneathiella sp.]|uniref:sensor histidine kinase n=1 Tax=Sneathiella sp. TaxID=1964365 RepID=UPI003567207B